MNEISVGIDDQIFIAQSRGGISKYFVELIQRLPDYGVNPVLLMSNTNNLHLIESGLLPTSEPSRKSSRNKFNWLTWRLAGVPNQIPDPFPRIDLIHHTFTNRRYLGISDSPSVTTIFDMTPELFPQYFRKGNPHLSKHRYCREVDALISISQSTKNDIDAIYRGKFSEKITVIPFGVGDQFFRRNVIDIKLPNEFLLFVGVRRGYKAFDVLCKAFKKVSKSHPKLMLVVVGGGDFVPSEAKLINELGIADKIVKINPTDSEIVEVYRRASAFVFPSEYEGFGLPTLEALATGTVAILADNSCMREVGGDAATYFETGNINDLTDKINASLDAKVASEAAEKGPIWASKFTWDHVAEKTSIFYRSILG